MTDLFSIISWIKINIIFNCNLLTSPVLFVFDRFLDPIILGDYPAEMRKILGPTLPEFTLKQKKKLHATKLDFIGLNHYSTWYLKDCIFSSCEMDPIDGDARALSLAEQDGVPIGKEVNIRLLNTNSFYVINRKTITNSYCCLTHADRSTILP